VTIAAGILAQKFLVFLIFWAMQLPKVAIIWVVGTIGGLICRRFNAVDLHGYIITSEMSRFKINYTHKLCCLSVYLMPLLVVIPPPQVGPVGLICTSWCSLASLIVLIKPIRENVPFFMLFFNAVDRSEDRPHTLEWMIGGNIIPGLFVILFFHRMFLFTQQTNLLYIMILATSLGDGLSEPVGIFFGKHKYVMPGWNRKVRHQRSLEGSACTLFVTMLVITCSWKVFLNAHQFFTSLSVVSALSTVLEAVVPHPSEIPIIMFAVGLSLTMTITFL